MFKQQNEMIEEGHPDHAKMSKPDVTLWSKAQIEPKALMLIVDILSGKLGNIKIHGGSVFYRDQDDSATKTAQVIYLEAPEKLMVMLSLEVADDLLETLDKTRDANDWEPDAATGFRKVVETLRAEQVVH